VKLARDKLDSKAFLEDTATTATLKRLLKSAHIILDKNDYRFHNGSKMELPEVNMVTVTIKNIPEEIYEKIKLQAKANRRSVNSEIISIFEHAVQKRTPMDVQQILERARKTRELTAHYTLSNEELDKWKKEGRE
jgi:hypothetical protein